MAQLSIPAANGRGSNRPLLSMLDGFELMVAGSTIRLPLSAQRVLVFVALHERPVQRLYVAGSLWLDSSEERAHASLRSALWRIRRVRVPLIKIDGNRLSLENEVLVDLQQAREVADHVLSEWDGRADVDQDPFTRDVLPSWYEDWVDFERERYRQLRLHVLERLCERLTEAGRPEKALQAGLAAVASEPLRETAHRAVMSAHLAEGNVCEAVRQFRQCDHLLRTHLGVAPSRRLKDLLQNLGIPEPSEDRGAGGLADHGGSGLT